MEGTGTVLEKLQVIISASTKPLRDALQKVNESVRRTKDSVEKQTGKISNAFKKMERTVAAALSVAAIISFGSACIELGSDLSEVQNVVTTTFGSATDEINRFSKNAITQFGLSELSAKQYTSTMGAMLKSMGLTSEQVLTMSKNMTGLAGDMASFYNLSGADAFAKIRAGISGETEPLKQLGINLSVANLEAYALSQGMTKAYSEMTQAEQAVLRYNYLLSVTKDAQGDFAKTSDSWANQTKILSERFNSLKASIGQGLINVFTPVLRVVNTLIERLAVAAETFRLFTEKVFGSSDSSGGGVNAALGVAAENTDTMAGAMNDTAKAAKETKGSLAGFDKLNNISSGKTDNTSSSGGSSAGGLAGMSGDSSFAENAVNGIGKINKELSKLKSGVGSLTKWISKNFGSTFSNIVKDGKKNFETLKKNLNSVWKDIKGLGSPLKSWFNSDYVPYLDTMLSYVGQQLNNLLLVFNTVFLSLWDSCIYPVLQNFIIVGLPLITQFATSTVQSMMVLSEELTGIFTKLWQEGVTPALAMLSKIWTDCVLILSETWKKYGGPIFAGINEAIRNTSEIFKSMWEERIKPVWDAFIETLSEVWEEHLKPFMSKLATFAASFVECALIIYNKFVAPVVKFLVETLGPIFSSVFNSITRTVGAVVGSIIDYCSGILTSLNGLIQFIKGVLTGDWEAAWEGIKEIYKGIWESMVGLASGPLNLVIGFINTFIAAAESAVNALIKGLNKIQVKIPDWVPEWGGKKYGISLDAVDFGQIPYLAKGGIVNRATLSVIGEAGKEAVLPLENNTGWMDKFSGYIVSKIDSKGIINAIERLISVVGTGDIYITTEIDGDPIYNVVVKKNKQHVKQTGRSEFIY